ncbi:hypothetical protein HPB47_001173 [Ixodes persulcatus]|uniref:Uncharacterized protein n=1 Tax=Ixodes persulcatus TaxID=34615 RepID=A0AC60PQF8_IXOPE|nr:hypothetical protein HPB47_001173 [Ixodes persulcatus]
MQWIAEAQRGMITQLMKDVVARLPQNVEPSTQASPKSAETSAEDFFGFDDFGSGEQGERCGASQELARYLSDTAGKEVTGILNYPSLHQLFLRYNVAVRSSASVERRFSIGGDVFQRKGGRLSDEKKFEGQLLLRANKPFWIVEAETRRQTVSRSGPALVYYLAEVLGGQRDAFETPMEPVSCQDPSRREKEEPVV